jgi:predicted SAM-dependent methyltransferase
MVPIENELFMDCKKLSFKPSTFDKIIFVAVLHHLASEETRMEALKECFRVLRKQGIMYLTVLSFE